MSHTYADALRRSLFANIGQRLKRSTSTLCFELKRSKAIAAIVERSTCFVILAKMPNAMAEATLEALTERTSITVFLLTLIVYGNVVAIKI